MQQAEGNTAERDRGWEWERLTLRGTVQQAEGNTAERDRGWEWVRVNAEGDGATDRREYSWKGQWLGLGERGMHRITRFTPCKQTNKQTNKQTACNRFHSISTADNHALNAKIRVRAHLTRVFFFIGSDKSRQAKEH